jgi:hypothetical protein
MGNSARVWAQHAGEGKDGRGGEEIKKLIDSGKTSNVKRYIGSQCMRRELFFCPDKRRILGLDFRGKILFFCNSDIARIMSSITRV